jgi:hypothetical protein
LFTRVDNYNNNTRLEGDNYALATLKQILPGFEFKVGPGGLMKSFFVAMLTNSGVQLIEPKLKQTKVHTITFTTIRREVKRKFGKIRYDNRMYITVFTEVGQKGWENVEFYVIMKNGVPNFVPFKLRDE